MDVTCARVKRSRVKKKLYLHDLAQEEKASLFVLNARDKRPKFLLVLSLATSCHEALASESGDDWALMGRVSSVTRVRQEVWTVLMFWDSLLAASHHNQHSWSHFYCFVFSRLSLVPKVSLSPCPLMSRQTMHPQNTMNHVKRTYSVLLNAFIYRHSEICIKMLLTLKVLCYFTNRITDCWCLTNQVQPVSIVFRKLYNPSKAHVSLLHQIWKCLFS